MNIMVMAAGEGTRLRPYTFTLPKPAMPFLNLPLAAHSLAFLEDIQIDKLIVNTFHLPEKVHELFLKIPHGAKELHFSDETGLILGNGGGLGKAESFFKGDGDFIMMNSDEVIFPHKNNILREAIAHHKQSDCIATLIVMSHPEVGQQFGGVWVDKNENVLGFGKAAPEGSDKGWHYIGVQILSERIFNYIPKDQPSNILHDVMKEALKQGEKVQCFPIECTWFETGNLHDFLNAATECLHFLASPHQTQEKACLQTALKKYSVDENNCSQKKDVLLLSSESAQIHPESKLSGFVSIGSQSIIGAGCNLSNVIIGENVCVPEGTQAENTILI